MKTEKFDLSKKRKQLKKDCQGFSVNNILDLVEQQDKEFIRLLKEDLIDLEGYSPETDDAISSFRLRIDNLSGDKLTK